MRKENSTAFSWFKKDTEAESKTRSPRRAPVSRDYTDSYQINRNLTRGLYFGEYPGLKLASALAMAPVRIPVFFTGFPIPTLLSENEQGQARLNTLVDSLRPRMQQIHIERRRDGTVWAWPRFDSELGRVVIEVIPDDTVSDIIRSLETGRIVRIETDEDITITTGYNSTETVRRRRTFTREFIETRYLSGQGSAGLENSILRNPIGILPIPFANEADGDDIRGRSIYSRILSDLKGYHDTDLMETNLLAKFKTKLLAGVSDVDEFAVNNGYDDANDLFENFDLSVADLLFYRKDNDDAPSLLSIESISAGFEDSLRRRYRKIVEGTGIPEIAWGLKTEGNMASVEENMATLMMYVEGDRRELYEPWRELYQAAYRLATGARMEAGGGEIDIEWNQLDSVSDLTRSEIFTNFTQGIAAVIDKAAITKETLHRLWFQNFPQATEEDFEVFDRQLRQAATFKGFSEAPYMEQLAAAGITLETEGDFVDVVNDGS